MPRFDQPPSLSFEDILLTPADERWRRQFTKQAQEDIKKCSGEFSSNDRLTAIFYELLRDHIAPGVLQQVFCENPPGTRNHFTNGWLAKYAAHLAKDVRNIPQEDDQLGPFYVNERLLEVMGLEGTWRWLMPHEQLEEGDVHFYGTSSGTTDVLYTRRDPAPDDKFVYVGSNAIWTFMRKVEKENTES